MLRFYLQSFFFVVQKVKMQFLSPCNWQPWVDAPYTQLATLQKEYYTKPNNAYDNFVGMKSPNLVVDFQEGLSEGRRNVTGTILWLFGWVGIWVFKIFF